MKSDTQFGDMLTGGGEPYGANIPTRTSLAATWTPEACGLDCSFDDSDTLRLADDLCNFSLSFG